MRAHAYDALTSGVRASRSAGGRRNTHTVSDSAASAISAPAPHEQLLPPTVSRRPAIQLVGLSKRFGDIVAVDDLDLVIDDGEFFSLLGPSGSGKTTVLRLIAGFEEPTAGAVLLAGADVTSKPPYDRDLNTVFQDYALFPHLDVQRNVEYGLKVKGVRKAERRRRAGELLEAVRLSGFASRRPNQLSGGQRQRVALARALVNHPRVLLLDEPLGALDLKLREEMQVELKALQRDVGITFVFVTHDQGEALSMSNRVAVFNNGRLEQMGTPREVYESPQTTFVATFVGTSNVLSAQQSKRLLGVDAAHSLRPERVRLDGPPAADGEVSVSGVLRDVQYLGSDCRARVDLDDGSHLLAHVPSEDATSLAVDTTVRLTWPRRAAFAVADTGTISDLPETTEGKPDELPEPAD
jgi:putative spermidine/putrescine transport system ATP-binding protein